MMVIFPEEERKRTERLLFRFVYHPDFHLPLLRGVLKERQVDFENASR